MPTIRFLVEHQQVEAKSGTRLRDAALGAGIYVNRELLRGVNCGGRGLCGTCGVWVSEPTSGAAGAPTIRERVHGLGRGRRLACQTEVLGDVEVTTMPGGDDRVEHERALAPSPRPTEEPGAPRKLPDEGPSIAYPLGHPQHVGRGEVPLPKPVEPAKPAADKKAAAQEKKPAAPDEKSEAEDGRPAASDKKPGAEDGRPAAEAAKPAAGAAKAAAGGETSAAQKRPADGTASAAQGALAQADAKPVSAGDKAAG
jgi:ferredoxin